MSTGGICAKCGRGTGHYNDYEAQWECEPFCGIKSVSVSRVAPSGSVRSPHIINAAPLGDVSNPNVRKRLRKKIK